MRHLLSVFSICLASLTMWGQNATNTVTGIVTDEKGEPLIGATVKIAGTSIGVATDIDGKFTLTLPAKKNKIDISYVGYTTQHIDAAPGETLKNIVMQATASDLEEMVVIGYGTAKKSSLTSSVEVISGDDLVKIPAMNVDQTLAGAVPGLGVMSSSGDPSSGSEAKLAIRGNNNNPLLVIDGVPRFGGNTSDGEMRLSDLNPDDIESISVLKDAAAAAVYGVRAANGVILVQTKRGKSEGKAKVNFRGQFNVQEATYLPKFLNAYQFAELYNRAVEAEREPVHTAYDLSLLGSNPNLYGDENMLDYLDKWGHSQRYTLSVSGGVKSVRYYLSGGYTNTKGLYSNVSRDRFNYSAKIDADLFTGLTAMVNLNGTVSTNKNSSYTTVDAAYNFSPLQVLRFTDGNLASIDGSNPLINVEGLGGYNRVKTDYHTLDAQLLYKLPWVDGLQVYVKGTLDLNHQNTKNFSKPVTLYRYDEATGTTSPDPRTVYPNAKITLQENWQSINNKLVEAGVNYNHTFNEKHDVTGMIVANYQDYCNQSLRAKNTDLPGVYPEIIGSTNSGVINGVETYTQRASLVGRATYGFDSRYYAEFSFRVDGSTRFAPGHRWGFFPTLSASWVLSNEKFFRPVMDTGVMSFAKLRASAGILGDDGSILDYSYLDKYMFTPTGGYQIGDIFLPGITIDTGSVPNVDLKWGKSKDWNVGIDLGFWNNRVNATVEYYQRYRTNMITAAPAYLFPPSVGTGGSVPNVNFGKIRYDGVDISLKHLNTIGDFKYSVGVNLSFSDNKVLDWGDESTVPENLRRKGKGALVWSLYDAAGLFQSYEEIAEWPVDQDGQGNATLAPGDIKYIDHDGNGVLTSNDKIYVNNSSLPDMHFGISLSASWKGIYMNAQFQGVTGYNQQLNELYTLENRSLQRFQDYHYTNSWTPENPNAEYPRIRFNTTNDNNRLASTFWVKNCSFMRLKALTIGYRFPAKMLRKAKLSTLDIALQGGNLFTISSLHNMDPESLRGYPLSRSYGLTLNFGI